MLVHVSLVIFDIGVFYFFSSGCGVLPIFLSSTLADRERDEDKRETLRMSLIKLTFIHFSYHQVNTNQNT